jgi:hypothetical protein
MQRSRINTNINIKHSLKKTRRILNGQVVKIDINVPYKNPKNTNKTSGLILLQYVLKLGYKTIHIAGMDFYQGEHQYLNTKNAKISELCNKAIRNNIKTYLDGQSAHTLEYDINYLNDLLAQYPAVKIIATSCHPETTKIWQQFKQVEVMELSSHQEPEIYDAYLDKQWLQKAVDDFSKKYGDKIKLRYKTKTKRHKRIKIIKRALAVIFLIGLVWFINQF